MLTELPFKPGVIKDEERYTARGAATDTQLMRWVRGRPQALGGWSTVLSGIQGTVRAMHEWTLTDGRPYLAIATSQKLYVFNGETLVDITPTRLINALPLNPIATTNGSANVTVTYTAHGAKLGDTVYLDGLTAVGGLSLGPIDGVGVLNPFSTTAGSRLVKVTRTAHLLANNDVVSFAAAADVGGITTAMLAADHRVIYLTANAFQIEMGTAATSTVAAGGGATTFIASKRYVIGSVLSANTFRITGPANASSTATGGGAAGRISFEINVGRDSTREANGYGTGAFGAGPFGGGGASLIDTTPLPLRQWSLDNFGNNLVACVSGGTLVGSATVSIFIWPLIDIARARATPLTNSPAQVTCLVTTPERFLLACGCTNEDGDFDPLLVRHTTGEDPTVWVASSSNSAGDFPVSGGSRIVGVVRRETGPMIFTDGGLNAVRSVFSADQIYKAEQVGVDCGLLGMHAGTQRDGDLYWITPALQFYVFRGGRPVALENPNRDWFKDRLNRLQADKVFAWPDREFEAVAWHYPTGGEGECTDYLRLDAPEARRDPTAGWSVGTMARTAASAGYVFPGKRPLAASPAGILYEHESGWGDGANPLERFVQWAPIDLRDGQSRASVRRILIDMTQEENLAILLGFREYPRGPVASRLLTMTVATEKCDTQGSGRQMDMRVSGTTTTFWRVGTIRADIKESTRR